eukprot:TRINITY_DN430_c0_g1_i1.p1 TRINITY_DN430_c0_g1~~TRINITY_DN430_c0_g1_i1.p1  ORF type:complete len:145 (-),score=46.27 TRINITY_DN430_c0_g1_i1:118-552(-)
MSLMINSTHRVALEEIFKLCAKEGKLNKEGLEQMFTMIDYKLPEDQMAEIYVKLFSKKEWVSFEDFLKIFQLKLTDYTLTDVYNAFRVLAKDDDKYIKLSKIKKILEEHNLTEIEVIFLTNQLLPYTDGKGNVDFNEFLKSITG